MIAYFTYTPHFHYISQSLAKLGTYQEFAGRGKLTGLSYKLATTKGGIEQH